MKILVTGASGFIGSHLVERLIKERNEVVCLVKESEKDNIPENRKDSIKLLKKLKVKIVRGDLLNKKSLEKAIGGVKAVYHLAAIARPMAIPNKLYFDVNAIGTRNLLEVCDKQGVEKIVVMSSVSAVGPSRNGNPVNETTKCKPIDVYGWSKLAQEKVVDEFVNNRKIDIVVLRPPMVFGERDFEMLRLFRAVDKRFFPISSNVNGIEFLYVENLVSACILAFEKGHKGEKYHVTNGRHYSINEIINSISKAEGKRLLPLKFPKMIFVGGGWFMEMLGKIFKFHPPFKHDTVEWMTKKFWYSDDSKLKKIGYSPKIGLDEGIKKTLDYYRMKNYIK